MTDTPDYSTLAHYREAARIHRAERDRLKEENDRLREYIGNTEDEAAFTNRLLVNQRVRVSMDADEDENDDAYVYRGQPVTLRILIQPNSDPSIWLCETEDGATISLFWHEIEPLEKAE